MMKYPLLSILLLAAFTSTPVVVAASERLDYRLSYSGLITGFFWKNLADVSFRLKPEAIKFRGAHACRLTMDVDTTHYTFAEIIHPVRYRWESTLTTNLQRTLLTRAIDEGKSNLHEVAWYDWDKRAIALFRKQKQLEDKKRQMPPEKYSNYAVPDFIHSPGLEGNEMDYLTQTGHFKSALSGTAIDPLTMIQRIRSHNFDLLDSVTMLVALDEELHQYSAHLEERISLKVNGQLHRTTLKIEITRASENGRDGVMYLWLSDSPERLPLRIDIDAPLGMIHLELQRAEENSEVKTCPSLQMVQGKTGPY